MEITTYTIINSISESLEIKFTKEVIERYYNPFMSILFFSKFDDTIFFANELNKIYPQPNKYQHFLFLHNSIRKRKRKLRVTKKNKTLESDISFIMNYYEISRKKAKETLALLTVDNLKEMRDFTLNHGGGILK